MTHSPADWDAFPLQAPAGGKVTRADKVVASIREQIVQGELKPGERLVELALTEQYAVARSTVREALQRLSAMGFVVGGTHRGYAVREFTHEDVIGLGEVFALLEVAAVRSLSFPIDPATVKAMRQIARQMAIVELPDEIDRLCQLDRAFHGYLVGAAGKPWIEDAWRRQGPLLSVMVVPILHAGPISGEIQRDRHLALLEAAANGGPEALEQAILDHYYQHADAVDADHR